MRGIVISVLFHGLVALAVALGLPFLHKTPVMPSQTVSVDIVRLSDITKVSKGEKPKPKPQKTPDADRDTAKKPVAKDQAAKPADPKPEKKVETKPETKAASKPKPAPKKQVAEKPVSPKPAETAKPKPVARAETPKQTPKQVEIDPSRVWLTVDGGGTFRDADTLMKLYAAAGVPTEGPEVNFCNTGHWASIGWFVSSELLGNEEAVMYDPSMVGWTDKGLPVEAAVSLK